MAIEDDHGYGDYLDLASWATMDPQLKKAACEGDEEFLKEAIASSKPRAYFLSRYVPSEQEDPYCAGNIFHLAVWHEKEDFLREAIRTLPREVVELLVCQQETAGQLLKWNPLHLAVFRRNIRLVDLIAICRWLWIDVSTAQDSQGRTPALLAVQLCEEEIANYLLRYGATDKIMKIADNEGNSPLFLAVQNDLCKFIESSSQHRNTWRHCGGPNGLTALHVAPKVTDNGIRSRLLSGCARFLMVTDNNGSTVLHTWVKIGDANVLKQCMDSFSPSVMSRMVVSIDKDGNNPLHLTAFSKIKAHATQVAEELVTLYHRSTTTPELRQNHQWPWQMKNNNGDTPFTLSIRHQREELALYLLSLDDINSLSSDNQENPLILAINNECDQVVQQIFALIPQPDRLASLLTFSDGANILRFPSNYLERVMKEVIEKFPSVINQPDKDGKTLLDKASDANAAWLVELLLRKDHSSMNKAPTAWKKACEKGHVSVILSFVKCPYFRGFCFGNRTTPLHHIQLTSYADYKEFILSHKIIEAMKNTRDINGATPLHKSIRDKNINLAEALLTTDGIQLTLEDRFYKTAVDLLADISSRDNEWAEMCKRVGIYLSLKTTYMKRDTDLLEMRGALSVVAGLLATITFTAGFTLPGGFDQNTGEAMLAKNAAFLMFLLADTYAMCCSMLVLFCLIWSMISHSHKSLLLIDYSMVILLHSLCATLVAFMTGVLAVIVHKSLWAAVIVIVVCTLLGISATIRRILFWFVDKVAPTEHTNDGCQNRMLKLLGNICKPKQNSSPESSATGSNALPV